MGNVLQPPRVEAKSTGCAQLQGTGLALAMAGTAFVFWILFDDHVRATWARIASTPPGQLHHDDALFVAVYPWFLVFAAVFGLSMVARLAGDWVTIIRWRGTRVSVSVDGLFVGRPGRESVYAWVDIERVSLARGAFTAFAASGEVIRVPLRVLDRVRLGDGPWQTMETPRIVSAAAHAYLTVGPDGVHEALVEPPRILTGTPRTVDGPARWLIWLRLILALAIIGTPFLGGLVYVAQRDGWRYVVVTATLATACMVGWTAGVWRLNRRSMSRSRVVAGPTGLTLGKGGNADEVVWGEVAALRKTVRRTVIAEIAGGPRQMQPSGVIHLNLNALARADGPLAHDVLAATCGHYADVSRSV